MTGDYLDNGVTIYRIAAGTKLLNRYRVVSNLGHGGMGEVWLVEDTRLDNEKLAVKMLPSLLVSDEQAYRQMKHEVLVAKKLVHPNILQVRSFEDNDGNPFILMDYIAGRTLAAHLAEKGRLGSEETLALLRPIAAALDYAHSQNVLHCDVSPDNVMIRKGDGIPFLFDFGVARDAEGGEADAKDVQLEGKLLYMSPERLKGAAPDRRQDVYSFAALAYKCLKGKAPFGIGAIEDRAGRGGPEPLGLRDCGNVELAKGIMSGLSANPDDRPKSCMAVLGEGVVHKEQDKASKGKYVAVSAVAVMACLVAFCGYVTLKNRLESRQINNPPVLPPTDTNTNSVVAVTNAPPALSPPTDTNTNIVVAVTNAPPALPPPTDTNANVVVAVTNAPPALPPPTDTNTNSVEAVAPKPTPSVCLPSHPVVVRDLENGDKVFKFPSGEEMYLKLCGTNMFWMGETEVTEAQWREVMGTNGNGKVTSSGDGFPKNRVSLAQCRKFMERLCEMTGGVKVSLPDTNSWVTACLAGSTTEYWWGRSPLNDSGDFGGNFGEKDLELHLVGKEDEEKRYPPNRWGLYDMHGNVAEWCEGCEEGFICGGGFEDDNAENCTARPERFLKPKMPFNGNENTGFRVFLRE